MKRTIDQRRCPRCGVAACYPRKRDHMLVCKTCGNVWPSPFKSTEIDELNLEVDHYQGKKG